MTDLEKRLRDKHDEWCGPCSYGDDCRWLRHLREMAAIAAELEREACAVAAEAARLPDHFRWGSEAMEQFDFGKERAGEAIRARGGQ